MTRYGTRALTLLRKSEAKRGEVGKVVKVVKEILGNPRDRKAVDQR